MATYTTTAPWSQSGASAGTTPLWIAAVANSLINCGFPQTSDTGQINPASPPTTAGSSASGGTLGYSVHAFSDALQSTAPIYFRVDYCYGSQYSYYPYLMLTFGTGTNGAGTITGTTISDRFGSTASGNSSTTLPWNAAGDGSYFTLSAGEATNTNPFVLVIDRARTATGAASSVGVGVLMFGYNNHGSATGNYTQSLAYTPARGGVIPAAIYPSMIPTGNTTASSQTGVSGNNVYLPGAFVFGYPDVYPSNAIYAVYNNDFPAGTVFTMTTLGATHTYRVLGSRYPNGSVYNLAKPPAANGTGSNDYATSITLALRYE